MFLLVLALCCLAKADSFLDEALLLQQEYPLIDGHNDLPWDIRKLVNDSVWAIDLKHLSGQTDITRLRKGTSVNFLLTFAKVNWVPSFGVFMCLVKCRERMLSVPQWNKLML